MVTSNEIPTPAIVLHRSVAEQNLSRMSEYARKHHLKLRPHTKTHKSLLFGAMQLENGAVGLTTAKADEARIMSGICNDILLAYSPVDPYRAGIVAELARTITVRVAVDSSYAVNMMAEAARTTESTVGLLVDIDVGFHRTGLQTPNESLKLAQEIDTMNGVRLDGIMIFPGQFHSPPSEQLDELQRISQTLEEIIQLWKEHGLSAEIVSGGSTPTAYQSHLIKPLTEIRPGTYIFNDMNCVHAESCTLDDCAASIVCTVVSNAVPGQVVIDAGSKTLSSDPLSGGRANSGYGYIVEYPSATITHLSEEHGMIDLSRCDKPPVVGDRIQVIPNHICPCINLADHVWVRTNEETLTQYPIEARGMNT